MKKNKNLPAIRFKGVAGEWLNEPIKKISGATFGGGTPSTSQKKYWKGKIPWIQSSDILEGVVGTVTAKKFITKAAIHKSATKLISENSLAIVTRVGVGKISLMEEEYTTSQDFLSLSDLKTDAQYSAYVIWRQLQKEKAQVQGTSIKGITKEELLGKLIDYPEDKKEQAKIGKLFQQLDTLVNQHQQKHEKLRCVKKALLTKMFPKQGETQPAIRFKGFSAAWEVKALGDVSKIKTGSSNREDSGLDGKYTFFDRSEDIRTSNIFLFDCEAVIVAGEGSDFIPKYFVGKFDLHQRTYAVMDFKDCDGKYLFYYIHLFRKHFLNYAVGSTVKSLRLPMFEEMPIQVPKKEEQTKIGNLFQQLDSLINQHQTQINKLNQIKQAMLAKMFV